RRRGGGGGMIPGMEDTVGPVLELGDTGLAVVAAIRALNPGVVVEERGSYIRVLVPHRCVVTRAAIEDALGREFVLPGDLEQVMPAFKGMIDVNEDQAVWAFGKP